jgi:flagellar biosynthesis/type III secretory pathway chaperone
MSRPIKSPRKSSIEFEGRSRASLGVATPPVGPWSDVAEGLYTILRGEAKVYRKLLLSAEKRRQALVKRDVELLKNLNEGDSAVIEGVKKYERDRMYLLKRTVSAFTPGYEELSLRELVDRMPQELSNRKEDLEKLRVELSKIVERLRDINEANALLTDRALAYIDFSIKLYVGAGDRDLTYRDMAVRRENVKNTAAPVVLDRKA